MIPVAYHIGAMGGKKLPYKRELAYLKSNGNQYILTDVIPCKAQVIDIDVALELRSAAVAFGSRSTGAYNTSYDQAYFNAQNRNEWHFLTAADKDYWSSPTFEYGEMIQLRNIPYSDLHNDAATQPFALFAFNVLGTISNKTRASIAKWRVRVGGRFIADYIPVLDLNDRPAMYDKVSGQLFYNQGTGEFTYGELSSVGGYKCIRRSSRFYWRSRASRASRRTSKRLEVAA